MSLLRAKLTSAPSDLAGSVQVPNSLVALPSTNSNWLTSFGLLDLDCKIGCKHEVSSVRQLDIDKAIRVGWL